MKYMYGEHQPLREGCTTWFNFFRLIYHFPCLQALGDKENYNSTYSCTCRLNNYHLKSIIFTCNMYMHVKEGLCWNISIQQRQKFINWIKYCWFFSDQGGQDPGQTASDAELGVQFTEIFIKKTDNVTLLLGLLEVLWTFFFFLSLLCFLCFFSVHSRWK